MGQRSGDRCGGRRRRRAAAVLLAVTVLAGCGGSGGGDGAAPSDEGSTTPPTTQPSAGRETVSTLGTTTTTTTTTAPPPSSLPEGAVKVPIDDALVDRLPQLEGGGRELSTSEAFDERFCNGDKAPAVPETQARATYPISGTDVITVAAYRFSSEGAAAYLADYALAVRSCAVEAGESAGLDAPDVFGSSFRLTTERGEAFIALALYEDVMWVLFHESTTGPPVVDRTTLDSFLMTVVG